MRIYFSTLDFPKKAAKRVKKQFSFGIETPLNMSLAQAQELTAELLGYSNWHELVTVTKSGKTPPSPLDENVSADEQKRRIDFQQNVLARWSALVEPCLREVTLRLRVSAGAPSSTKLDEDAYRKNRIVYWEPGLGESEAWGEKPEWRFFPSLRSQDKTEEIYELFELWEGGQLNYGEYEDALIAIIKVQPENVSAYMHIISATVRLGIVRGTKRLLTKLEKALLDSFPSNFPKKGKAPPFIWGTIDNRDFLRAIYFLGVAHYAHGHYIKAKKWFQTLHRISEIELGREAVYLADMAKISPTGDLHVMEYE